MELVQRGSGISQNGTRSSGFVSHTLLITAWRGNSPPSPEGPGTLHYATACTITPWKRNKTPELIDAVFTPAYASDTHLRQVGRSLICAI